MEITESINDLQMERRDSLTKEEKNRNAQRRQSMLAVTDIAKMNKTKM